jgi:vancomycin resistance protein YoaR
MKDEAKTQLKKIIGDYDARLAESERVDAVNRAANAAFPERFVAFKTKTIRPALQEIADLLNERGHEATVREQEESSSTAGGVKSAAVSLRVIPKPFAHKSTEPNPTSIEVTFAANRSDRTVTVSSTNTMLSHGGSVGKRGAYEIDAVTVDVVASHVIQTLHDAFGGQR